MEAKHNNYETHNQQKAEEPGRDSDTAQSTMERGAEILEQAEEAVGDFKDKTTQVVSETVEQARSYGSKNPGKTVLIALGVGVGLGFLLGASVRRSGANGRFARPVVNALSDIALAFFR